VKVGNREKVQLAWIILASDIAICCRQNPFPRSLSHCTGVPFQDHARFGGGLTDINRHQNIFDCTSKDMAIIRKPGCKWRTVIKNILSRTFAELERSLKCIDPFPESKDLFLDLSELEFSFTGRNCLVL
jgi:hypothetical protein